LESEAIRNSDFSKKQFIELEQINQRFRAAEDNVERIALDKEFHQKLLENYPNQSAKKIIEDVRARISIYELKFMNIEPVAPSFQMHNQLIKSLEDGNLELASKELIRNWEISIHYIQNNHED
jgi:DNA-binding GntR family transcriptional regulator